MMHCHCSRCRKHHGSAFATFVGAPATGFQWLRGKNSISDVDAGTNGFPRYLLPDVRFGKVPAPTTPVSCASCRPAISSKTAAQDPKCTSSPHRKRRGTRSPIGAPVPGRTDGYADPNIADGCAQRRPSRRDRRQLFMRRGSLRSRRRAAGDGELPLLALPPRPQRGARNQHVRRRSISSAGPAAKDHVKVFDLPGAERFGINFCGICGSDVPRHSPKIGRVNIPGGQPRHGPRHTSRLSHLRRLEGAVVRDHGCVAAVRNDGSVARSKHDARRHRLDGGNSRARAYKSDAVRVSIPIDIPRRSAR